MLAPKRALVLGAGISGLLAAHRLRQQLGDSATIVIADPEPASGGKLRTGTLGQSGGPVELGAEAFVRRRPEVTGLAEELGVADQLVHPSGLRPAIWSGHELHPMPAGTFMGIPLGPEALDGLVDDATLARIADEPGMPLDWTPGQDASLGQLIAERFGQQVVQRSVDPLMAGVYGGGTEHIGVRAATPELAAALDRGATSVTAAARSALRPGPAGPVFATFRDGYRILVDALELAARAERSPATLDQPLRADGRGWDAGPLGHADIVVIATPAHAAARLLAQAAPEASRELARIQHASAALVTLDLPLEAGIPQHSGVLVATGEELTAKAFTFTSRKWTHQAHRNLVRVSLGRFGDDPGTSILDQPDARIIDIARADLRTVTGVADAPLATRVQRWRDGLPQYEPGHAERITTIEQAVAPLPGLVVAGAYLHGVGVPACIATADAAVAQALSGMAG
ncbi:protoporphyrinogen oxidase [Lolliginicoccus suaedae]|uniref:protoporphyrinogen oxidase n=1 Tax=Lolliginicoccus suaedae TaxID=2605429 RepID=UPI0011EC12AF|nr:protoporphyrinogen oxidase [Lolliginicoccus suaedae]